MAKQNRLNKVDNRKRDKGKYKNKVDGKRASKYNKRRNRNDWE